MSQLSAFERLRRFCLMPDERAEVRRTWPALDEARRLSLERATDAQVAIQLLLHPTRVMAGDSGPTLALGVATQGVFWALAAQREALDRTSLRAALDGLPSEVRAALGAEAVLATLERTVASPPLDGPQAQLELTRISKLLSGLIDRARQGDRAVSKTTATMWLRSGLVLSGLLIIASLVNSAVRIALRPKDLAEGKPWRTSSSALSCVPAEHNCGGTKTDILFHTQEEDSPWFEIDLGAPTSISAATVRNRTDCCQDRAIPLVLEVSDDTTTWREVAKRDAAFVTWNVEFPSQTARYVRARGLRRTILHLDGVLVHP